MLKFDIGGIPFEPKDLFKWMVKLDKEKRIEEFDLLWEKIENAIRTAQINELIHVVLPREKWIVENPKIHKEHELEKETNQKITLRLKQKIKELENQTNLFDQTGTDPTLSTLKQVLGEISDKQ